MLNLELLNDIYELDDYLNIVNILTYYSPLKLILLDMLQLITLILSLLFYSNN